MSVEQLKQAMLEKKAEMMPNDEDRLVPGKMELYPEPEGHAQNFPTTEPEYTKGVVDATHQTRAKVLDRAFANKDSASALDKAYVAAHFSTTDYESHSPLLQKSASPTLAEQVKKVVGRR